MPESSSSEDGDTLSDILKRSLVKSAFDKTAHGFVPNGVLSDINGVITRSSILAAMKIPQPTREDDELICFILTKAKKLFAIISFIGLKKPRRAMLLFKKQGFDDTELPIKDTSSNSSSGSSSSGGSSDATKATEGFLASMERAANGNVKIWHYRKEYDFCRAQWKFLAPVFLADEPNRYLEEAYIIPFVSKHDDFGEGSFGQVYKYEIHADHLRDPSSLTRGPCIFAVKEIKPKTVKERQKVARHWEFEAKALARMNTLNQDHIVRFITAFCRVKNDGLEREHYLVFEWADGGNLRDLWRSRLALTASLVKAVVKQLVGLAQALSKAHYLDAESSYRHGDLKPANILRFLDGGEIGTLKIGDWGEAKEHNRSTELRTSKTTAEYGTRRYEAPEVEVGLCVTGKVTGKDQVQGLRSRLYDIWAMGCITIEFIVWLVYGPDGLDRFNRDVKGEFSADSPFYQISTVKGNKVARVHSAVVRWMDKMEQDAACQIGITALGDILDLVRGGLLVVKLPQRMGSNLRPINSHQALLSPVSTEVELGRNPSDDASALQNLSTSPELLAEGEGVPSVKLAPSIKLTLVEPIRAPTEPKPKPKPEPEPEPEGPARLLATRFHQRLEIILSHDGDEGYWFTDQAPLPTAPPSLIGSPSVPEHDRTEYDLPTTISRQTASNLRPFERLRVRTRTNSATVDISTIPGTLLTSRRPKYRL